MPRRSRKSARTASNDEDQHEQRWDGAWGADRLAPSEPQGRRVQAAYQSMYPRGKTRMEEHDRSFCLRFVGACENLFDAFLERASVGETSWLLLNSLMHGDGIGGAQAYAALGEAVWEHPTDAQLLPVVHSMDSLPVVMVQSGGMWALLQRVLTNPQLRAELRTGALVDSVLWMCRNKLADTDRLARFTDVNLEHVRSSAAAMVPAVEALFGLLKERLAAALAEPVVVPTDAAATGRRKADAEALRRLLRLRSYPGSSAYEDAQSVLNEVSAVLHGPDIYYGMHPTHRARSHWEQYEGFNVDERPTVGAGSTAAHQATAALTMSVLVQAIESVASGWLLDLLLGVVDWPIEVLVVAVHEAFKGTQDAELHSFGARIVDLLLSPARLDATRRWCASDWPDWPEVLDRCPVTRVSRYARVNMETSLLCAEERNLGGVFGVRDTVRDFPHRLAGGRLNALLGAVWAGRQSTADMYAPEHARHAMCRLLAEVEWPPAQTELLFRELLERHATDLEQAWPLLNAQLERAASLDGSVEALESTFFGASWESQQPLQLVYRSAPERALEMLDGCALFTPRAHHQLLALAVASDDLEWVRRIVERMRARDIAMPLRWPGAMHHDFADQLPEHFWYRAREDAKENGDVHFLGEGHSVDPREAWTYWSTHPVDVEQARDVELGVAKLRPLGPPRPDLDAFLPCVVKLCPRALPYFLDVDDYDAEHRGLALATALGLCMDSPPTPRCPTSNARIRRALDRATENAPSATSRITLAMVASAFDDEFATEFEQACEDPDWQPLLLAAEILMSPPYAVQLGEDPLGSGLTEAGGTEEPLPDLRDRDLHWVSARLFGLVHARVRFLVPERVPLRTDKVLTPAAARAAAPYNANAVAHRPVLYEPRSANTRVIALWRTRKFAELVAERVWAPDGEAGAALRAEQAGSGRWAR